MIGCPLDQAWYHSSQSHFSKIKVKLAQKNKFVTHFIQIETFKDVQKCAKIGKTRTFPKISDKKGSTSESVLACVSAAREAETGSE